MLDLALLTSPTGTRIDAPTPQATGVTASWNLQGCEALNAALPITLTNAFHLVDTPGTQHGQLNDGPVEVWGGRLENPTLTDEGTTLEALGYSRALADLPYTCLWSHTLIDQWIPLTRNEVTFFESEKFEQNQSGQLYIAPRSGENFNDMRWGGFGMYIPYSPNSAPTVSGRAIIGASFDLEMLCPVSWQFGISSANSIWTLAAATAVLNSTAALQRVSYNLTFTGTERIVVWLRYTGTASPAVTAYGGETGAAYIKITNMRLVSSTTNRVNTTLTIARTNGVGVTLTVGSTARMYVGQLLTINSGGANSESVTVLTIPSGTTFTATVVNAGAGYAIGTAVQGHIVYADEVAADIASFVNGINSTQLSSSAALIQSPGRDLPDALWQDAYGADVLADLVQRGDTTVPPRRWVWSVEAGRLLRFAPLGNGGRTWYVDAAGITVQLSRENLYNDAYAVYDDSGAGLALRTAVNPSATSVARFGLTRRQMVAVQGSNALQAAAARDTAITQGAFPPPKVQVNFDAVYDGSGARWPLYLIRPGDTLFIRNLPPTLSTTVDQIRSFIIARVEYSLDSDAITVEPLDPLPTLEAALVG